MDRFSDFMKIAGDGIIHQSKLTALPDLFRALHLPNARRVAFLGNEKRFDFFHLAWILKKLKLLSLGKANHFHFDRCGSSSHHFQLFRRRFAHIDDPALFKRPAIIDPNDGRAIRGKVGYFHHGPERESSMRGGHR
jgi:hypothetical protein